MQKVIKRCVLSRIGFTLYFVFSTCSIPLYICSIYYIHLLGVLTLTLNQFPLKA